MAQVRLVRVIPSMHAHLCVVSCLSSSSTFSVLYFVPPFSFQPVLMFTSEFNERSRSNPLCDFRLGTVVTSDYETPLTDLVPSIVQSANHEALLYVFEDNEAVIKMIMKGRSPTMRHVSRTHRVALDWLFDRINLDTKIQIKYNDTKNQLADILTKGSFTRDEWNHIQNHVRIANFSGESREITIHSKYSYFLMVL